MSNSRNRMELIDRKRINVNQPSELRYWSKIYNISRQELQTAISKVGNSTDFLFAFLKG